MPTPCVHSALAYVAFCASSKQDPERMRGEERISKSRRLAIFLLASNLPDLDFLPGILSRNPTMYHHYASHSLLIATLTALICGKLLLKGTSYIPLIFVAISHPLLDIFTVDSKGWYATHHGIPLFWPLSRQETSPIYPIFTAPYVGMNWRWLTSTENFKIGLFEALISLCLAAVSYFSRPYFIRLVEKRGLLAR